MRSILILLACFAALTAFGQAVTPKPGSPERKALMDALRVPVQKALKTKVQFKVNWLKTQGDWAFLKGVPQQANGKKIDYSKTSYKEQIEAGMFDDWICALYKKKNGKWTVVRYVIGATDVVYEPWPKEFGAPKGIFFLPKDGLMGE